MKYAVNRYFLYKGKKLWNEIILCRGRTEHCQGSKSVVLSAKVSFTNDFQSVVCYSSKNDSLCRCFCLVL